MQETNSTAAVVNNTAQPAPTTETTATSPKQPEAMTTTKEPEPTVKETQMTLSMTETQLRKMIDEIVESKRLLIEQIVDAKIKKLFPLTDDLAKQVVAMTDFISKDEAIALMREEMAKQAVVLNSVEGKAIIGIQQFFINAFVIWTIMVKVIFGPFVKENIARPLMKAEIGRHLYIQDESENSYTPDMNEATPSMRLPHKYVDDKGRIKENDGHYSLVKPNSEDRGKRESYLNIKNLEQEDESEDNGFGSVRDDSMREPLNASSRKVQYEGGE